MRQFESLIKDTLNKNKSEKLKAFQEKLINTKYEILGVKLEIPKALAKSLCKERKEDLIKYLEDPCLDTLDEIMVYGFTIAYYKCDVKTKIYYLDKYLKYVDNWSSCDSICAAFKDVNQHKEEYFNYFTNLSKSESEYTRRLAIVMFLDYFIVDDYIDKVLYIIKNIKDDRYYVNMAIAWFIATSLAKQWSKTIELILHQDLDKWVHNKAITKARESYRITKEQKEELIKYKIK